MGDNENNDEFLSYPYEYEQGDVDNLMAFDKTRNKYLPAWIQQKRAY